MMFFRVSVIAVAALLAAAPAQAQTWELAGSTDDTDTYVDTSSVLLAGGQRIKFWYELRFLKPHRYPSGRLADTFVNYVEADCTEMSYSILQQSSTYQGRTVLTPWAPNTGTHYARPGSVAHGLVSAACRAAPWA